MNDPRMVSYGWGYLGRLYEEEAKDQQALELTRRAIQAAREGNAPDALWLSAMLFFQLTVPRTSFHEGAVVISC